MKLLVAYLRARAGTASLAAALCGVFLLFAWLSGMERSLALYCLLLWAAVCALALALGFAGFFRRHRALEDTKARLLITPDCLPAPGSLLEEDYQELLHLVLEDRSEQRRRADRRAGEMKDTFGLWAHQIKNPLAAMRLILQQEESPDPGELEQELFETEQYVEMALNYLRLDSESTDFVLRPCRLDGIIRQAVKKYARQFIRRRISLAYEGTELQVVSDEKWLGFVLEQLISNALKYTNRGTVRIYTRGDRLFIQDTGIGIAQEDLPRIFDKGYTGYNGRADRKSTGLGLWLCRRTLEQLGHEISASSVSGQGTELCIRFKTEENHEAE